MSNVERDKSGELVGDGNGDGNRTFLRGGSYLSTASERLTGA